MSNLTKQIQNAGLHCENCGESTYAISEKEAKAIREMVKQACIEALDKMEDWTDKHEAIEIIKGVK